MAHAASAHAASAARQPAAAETEIAAVADNLSGLMRAFGKARAQMLAAAEQDVEWSAHMVLKCLASDGPLRASSLAAHVHSDPSTVSRQVATLVKEGLVERRADPVDGRASLLVVTPKAAKVLRAHEQARNAHFARMLAHWSDRDLHRFATLLARFTDDFIASNHDVFPEPAETQPVPAERTS